jgi:hypothetical protein
VDRAYPFSGIIERRICSMKREMDFSEGNLRNRWFGVKGIWKEIEGEVKGVQK